MGLEAKHTTITIDGTAHEGDALLETDELFVRVASEPKRRKLAMRALTSVRGSGTSLAFEHDGHRYTIEVDGAAHWAEKIVSPPSLLDKLGIKSGSRVHVRGLDDDASFASALASAKVEHVSLNGDPSVVVRAIETRTELSFIAKARRAVGDELALWIAYPKGKKELTEDHVRAAAITEGMVDVKVARFSDTRSVLKLVVRKGERAPKKKK